MAENVIRIQARTTGDGLELETRGTATVLRIIRDGVNVGAIELSKMQRRLLIQELSKQPF